MNGHFHSYAAVAAGLRDFAIVWFGGTYIIGHFLLSLYANQLNVGSAVGSDINYYVTGGLISGILLCGWYLFVTSVGLLRGERPVREYITAVVLVLVFLPILFLLVVELAQVDDQLYHFFLWLGIIGVVILCLTSSYLVFIASREAMWTMITSTWCRWAVGLATFILVIVVYTMLTPALMTLDRLPQTFGGVKPQCAQLDIAWSELSEQTRQHLQIIGYRGKVASTPKLQVRFTSTDYVVLTVDGQSLQINQSVIRAIRWC